MTEIFLLYLEKYFLLGSNFSCFLSHHKTLQIASLDSGGISHSAVGTHKSHITCLSPKSVCKANHLSSTADTTNRVRKWRSLSFQMVSSFWCTTLDLWQAYKKQRFGEHLMLSVVLGRTHLLPHDLSQQESTSTRFTTLFFMVKFDCIPAPHPYQMPSSKDGNII